MWRSHFPSYSPMVLGHAWYTSIGRIAGIAAIITTLWFGQRAWATSRTRSTLVTNSPSVSTVDGASISASTTRMMLPPAS